MPLDLEVAQGTFLAVIGPNGSGKSTLLRILAGLLKPSTGGGAILGSEFPKEAWRLKGRVGYLGHDPLLYRELTARENLEFAARLHGLPDRRERIDELFEAMSISAISERKVGELSAGLTQRVAACRAVLHDPDLLILDEPEANLDSDSRGEVERIFARAGRTRVVASHDRQRMLTTADQVLELG